LISYQNANYTGHGEDDQVFDVEFSTDSGQVTLTFGLRDLISTMQSLSIMVQRAEQDAAVKRNRSSVVLERVASFDTGVTIDGRVSLILQGARGLMFQGALNGSQAAALSAELGVAVTRANPTRPDQAH
jgi:hypothetical protein